MARIGALVVSLLVTAAALVGVPGAAAAAALDRPATDFVTLDSAPDDPVGQGRALTWTGDQITLVHGVGTALMIDAQGASGDAWTWIFRAPAGERLGPGVYDDASGRVSPGPEPGIHLAGDGTGCNEASGRFRVLELAPDLSRIWILYEHRCENPEPSLAAWGEIRIGMPDVAPDLTLLPESLRLPDWYPGLDAVAQPVMVFNTGSDPLSVTGAAVTSGQSDFRVVGGVDACADLAARESCRVLVGFRPSRAGNRSGSLRLTTSAGARDVALTGFGYPGTTELRLQGGADDPYVATPDAWTMFGGADGRLVVFNVREAGFGDSISLRLTAPEGGFRAGRTYSACCTEVGPSMSLGVAGAGIGGAGSFTVHEVAFDGGELERFAASFRKHSSSRGWYVGTIAWRASTPPPVPALPPESDAAPLTIETDRASYRSGDVAGVTVEVPDGAGHEVTLYAERRYGGSYLVGTAPADALGRARFDVPLWNETGLAAASGTHTGFASIQVTETPVVVARASGQLRRKGRFLLFRAGKPARFVAAATPVVGTECLRAQVQRRQRTGWRAVSAACLDVQDLTIAEYRVGGRTGERKRVRFVLPAAGARPAAASAWIYLEFVRRRG